MKEKDRVNRILKYLLEKRKATWTQLHQDLNISSKELSQDLKNLLNELPPQITTCKDRKDRRVTWYMPIEDKAVMETRRYEAMQHLENLKNPIYDEISVPKGAFKVYISVFGEQGGIDREKGRKNLKQIMHVMRRNIDTMDKSVFMPLALEKIVLFFMIEKK